MEREPPALDGRLQAIREAEYPAFSDREMAARRARLEAVMAQAGVGHALVYGANRHGSGVQWLTGWPVTAEAMAVVTPGRRDALFVQYYNHVPLAIRLAPEAVVAWGGASTLESAMGELAARGAAGRIGVIGPLAFGPHRILTSKYPEVVDLNRAYTELRLVKSAEEVDWLRIGAWLSDRAIDALTGSLAPGMTEWALADCVERAYVPFGGATHIHFFGVTSMRAPARCVPAQFSSNRRTEAGDVLFTELSAAFWGYPGQVLRTFAIGAEPIPLYRDLHATAEAAFDAVCGAIRDGARPEAVVAASGMIEDAGFTTCDDLVHGFGGGYLPPILGSASRPAGPLPDLAFAAGMTVVVQPNVITRDRRAGVQTGALVRVTEDGVEPLHRAPRGLIVVA